MLILAGRRSRPLPSKCVITDDAYAPRACGSPVGPVRAEEHTRCKYDRNTRCAHPPVHCMHTEYRGQCSLSRLAHCHRRRVMPTARAARQHKRRTGVAGGYEHEYGRDAFRRGMPSSLRCSSSLRGFGSTSLSEAGAATRLRPTERAPRPIKEAAPSLWHAAAGRASR